MFVNICKDSTWQIQENPLKTRKKAKPFASYKINTQKVVLTNTPDQLENVTENKEGTLMVAPGTPGWGSNSISAQVLIFRVVTSSPTYGPYLKQNPANNKLIATKTQQEVGDLEEN